jgi:hypothetical protein
LGFDSLLEGRAAAVFVAVKTDGSHTASAGRAHFLFVWKVDALRN